MKKFPHSDLQTPGNFLRWKVVQIQGWFIRQFYIIIYSQFSGLTAPLGHNKAAAALTHLPHISTCHRNKGIPWFCGP